MSKPSLAEIRAKYKQKAEGKDKKSFTNTDVYPFWNIPENATATVRILPDKNEDNGEFFYVDKLEHKLLVDGKDRKISCPKMWNEKCPICELSSKYYKAEGKDSPRGKYYYLKRTSLMKALILKDPIDYSAGGESAVGQVKTLQLTGQLMKLIIASIATEEEEKALEALPWDLEEGYNFIIKKTKDGKWDKYDLGSGFSNKVSSVSDDLMEVAQEGMIDLSTMLPENPGVDKVQALLEAHLSGSSVEDEDDDAVPTKATRKVEETVDEEEEIPVKRRKVIEEEEEEVVAPPVKKRKPIDEEEEVAAPVKKKVAPAVVEEEEEEVAAPVKKKTAPVVEEAEDDGDEDAALIARIRARKKSAE